MTGILPVVLRSPSFVDVVDGFLDGVNVVGFLVGDFNQEFILDRHQHFDRVQRVQSEVLGEVRRQCELSLLFRCYYFCYCKGKSHLR